MGKYNFNLKYKIYSKQNVIHKQNTTCLLMFKTQQSFKFKQKRRNSFTVQKFSSLFRNRIDHLMDKFKLNLMINFCLLDMKSDSEGR